MGRTSCATGRRGAALAVPLLAMPLLAVPLLAVVPSSASADARPGRPRRPAQPAPPVPPTRSSPRAPGWCKPDGALTARTMPRKIRISECDLRGRTVRGANGLEAFVPDDGTSVSAHVLRTDGAAELRVEIDERSQEISITTRGPRLPQGRPRKSRAPLDPCTDGAYVPEPGKWPKGSTIQWRYYPGGTGQPIAGISRGVSNAANAVTDCTPAGRFQPPPDVSTAYAGAASVPPDLTAQASCGRRDGTNVFGWWAMPGAESEVLAATCVWFAGSTTVESDMALQEYGKTWWSGDTDGGRDPRECPAGSFDTTAVVTHETGHVLGLAHVEGPDHAKLTMAPSVASCDSGPATLGKGDYDGLIALYGER
ncbi:matrixin family metalloprotease [Actinomadura fibrosa]|uniref:Matrixin family metalloprotease n=1 Tax=Actinomadura fibrosa TaxID=111802 RepID=A0ABW2XCV6_9ACTN|nr:matrixin family metalloprotease [Actinomadura fibrosa]